MIDTVDKWEKFYAAGVHPKHIIGDAVLHCPLFIEIIKMQPRNILEVGIGRGTMSIILGLLGFKVTGIDNSNYLVSLADRGVQKMHLNKRVSFILGDAFKLSNTFYEQESSEKTKFDCCFSHGLFEHFSDKQIQALITEQLKVSKVVIFCVPSNFYPLQDFGDERLLSSEKWREILKDFNIRLIKYYGRLLSFYTGIKNIVFKKNLNYPNFKPSNILIKIGR